MNQRAHHGFPQSFARFILVPVLIGCAALSALFGVIARAASAPNILNYQGRLLNTNGVPDASPTASMVFEIYDSLAAGTCLWSNSSATCATATSRTVTLTDGLFSEPLGDTTVGVPYAAIADTVFGNNAGTYLQVTVNGETLTPRKQIVAAPYALNADTLDGLDSSAFTSLFTDGGTFTYLTSATDDLVIGGVTVPAASLFFDASVAELNLGTDSALNGLIRLYSSGAVVDATIGTNVSGDLVLTTPGIISVASNITSSADLALNGGDLTSTSAVFKLADAVGNSATIQIGGVSTDLANTVNIATDSTSADSIVIGSIHAASTAQLRGATTTLNGTVALNLNDASGTKTTDIGGVDSDGVDTVRIATDGTSADALTIGNSNALTALAITGGDDWSITTGGIATFSTLLSNGFDRATAGSLTFGNTTATSVSICSSTACDTVDIAQNADADSINIATDATSGDAINMGNSNAGTTFDITGGSRISLDSASTVYVNDAAGTRSVNIGGVLLDGASTVSIATNSTSADTINIGNSNASTALALIGGDDWSLASTGILTLSASAAQATAIILTDTDYTDAISVGDNNIVGTTGAIDFTNFDVSTAGTINIAVNQGLDTNAAGALTIGGTNATSVTLCNSPACTSLAIGVSANANTISIGDVSDSVALTSANWSIASSGLITTANDLAVNGGDLTSSAGIFRFLDSATSSAEIRIGGVSAGSDLANSIYIATDGTTADLIQIGNTNGSSTLQLNGGDDYQLLETGVFTLSASAAQTTAIVVTDTSYTNALSIGDNNIVGTTGAIDLTNFDVAATGVTSVNLNATATLFGICHSGADVNAATDTERDLVACSGAPGDYAEWYETDGSAGAGDIVASSPAIFTYQATQSNAYTGEILSGTVTKTLPILTKATSSDNDIFGIISSSPNQIIGTNVKDQGAHPEPIALVGRVPLHVTSENGPITAGDYLTVSSTPGYAMKATAPGRVIARALTNFNGVGMTTITAFIDNTWYGGDMLAANGTAQVLTGDLQLSALANATASSTTENSHALLLTGSAWNGSNAVDATMGLRTKVSSLSNYRLAFENMLGGEVASITNTGDILVSGKLFPSDRGLTQTDAYIFYDSSAGGGYMKTNAAGWNVGSYDFAEMFPSDEALAAGEVVVFADRAQAVKRSGSTTYDNKLVGVVSTRPGFLAGEYKAGSFPIALSGRVPTNVSDENGAVAIGDPLTTSSTPGVAMKATKAGPILGYAMEPLASGSGKVVAFVRASYYSGSGTNPAPDANNTVSGISTAASLDLSGTLNMNGGNILSVGSLEGIGGAWKIAENGDFTTKGAVVKQVRSYMGELVNTYPATTTERTVELSGTSTLQNGTATVTFTEVDPRFNQIISATASYRVLVTPAGATGQVYVTDRSNGGFVIHDTGSSTGVMVDWLVIAYEKDHEPQEVTSIPLAPEPTPVPEPTPAPEVAGITDPVPPIVDPVAPPAEQPAPPAPEPVLVEEPVVTEPVPAPEPTAPPTEEPTPLPTLEPTSP